MRGSVPAVILSVVASLACAQRPPGAPPAAPPGAPGAPSDLTAVAGSKSVVLSWTAVADASSYDLYWTMSAGVNKANGTRIADVSSPFTHHGLANGREYHYVLTAVGPDGESPESSEASATPHGSSWGAFAWGIDAWGK